MGPLAAQTTTHSWHQPPTQTATDLTLHNFPLFTWPGQNAGHGRCFSPTLQRVETTQITEDTNQSPGAAAAVSRRASRGESNLPRLEGSSPPPRLPPRAISPSTFRSTIACGLPPDHPPPPPPSNLASYSGGGVPQQVVIARRPAGRQMELPPPPHRGQWPRLAGCHDAVRDAPRASLAESSQRDLPRKPRTRVESMYQHPRHRYLLRLRHCCPAFAYRLGLGRGRAPAGRHSKSRSPAAWIGSAQSKNRAG